MNDLLSPTKAAEFTALVLFVHGAFHAVSRMWFAVDVACLVAPTFGFTSASHFLSYCISSATSSSCGSQIQGTQQRQWPIQHGPSLHWMQSTLHEHFGLCDAVPIGTLSIVSARDDAVVCGAFKSSIEQGTSGGFRSTQRCHGGNRCHVPLGLLQLSQGDGPSIDCGTVHFGNWICLFDAVVRIVARQ